METGTGKTYVYLRTIFELNARFGFTKFVIVVPSVAIKEGVYKTLQITEDHFRGLYADTPFEYFLYDSGKLGQVRNFATSPNIQIMVVTVGAINKKDVNNLYKDSEKTGGEKPIDLIRATRPIVIVDEPQSVDGGLEGRGKEALGMMNPLCTLRYSATHADKHHMVFRLDAVDAYERKLVKQIEVASAGVEGDHNKPYVRLVSASQQAWQRSRRKVELDVQRGNRVSREEKTVQDGDDLEQITGRAVYANCRDRRDPRAARAKSFIEVKVPGGEHWLQPGRGDRRRGRRRDEAPDDPPHDQGTPGQGAAPAPAGHQGAEPVLHRQRSSATASTTRTGIPRRASTREIFEEEYRRLAGHPDYQSLFKEVDVRSDAAEVHDGYFSIDKKGAWSDTAENNQGNRDNAERAYNLIMKDKEKLLSFETKLKFIFSHSALREGWDNPNVFQICALREIGTERERRQTIGRGLRLCVNQEGERLRGFDVNTLTVVATESYEQFAENLQKEIEEDTGIRFGIVEKHQFAAIPVTDADGSHRGARVRAVRGHLDSSASRPGLVDAKGKVQDSLQAGTQGRTRCALPEAFAAASASGHGRPAQAGRQAGDQERRRAEAGQDAPGRPAQRGVQGALGPDQAQDDLPRPVRQRDADRRPAPRRSRTRRRSPRRACNGARPTSPSARPASRRRRRPYPPRSCSRKATSSCPTC